MNPRDELALGTDALRKGDAARARDHFVRCIQGDQANTAALLGLAHAALRLNDEATQIAAIDQLLRLEPANPRGLILKADHLDRQGDTRSAASFYMHALKTIPPGRQLPSDLANELRRAQATLARYAEQYQEYIQGQLKAEGFDRNTSSARFAQSLDIILGKKKIYLQQPRYYFFPSLPQIQFYERA